jgi:hypothetical protein
MDNAPIQKAKASHARLSQMPVHLAPHPLYSPALVPSDFFLFGYLKSKLVGLEFESTDELLGWIKTELMWIPGQILEKVLDTGSCAWRNAST